MATLEDYRNARFAYTENARFMRIPNQNYPWLGMNLLSGQEVSYTDRMMLEINAIIVEQSAISVQLGEKYESLQKKNKELELTVKEQRGKIKDLQEQNEIERIQDAIASCLPHVPMKHTEVSAMAKMLYNQGLRKEQA